MTAPLVDILVPVLGRPQRAEPFMRSLAESIPGHVAVWVGVSTWDTETLAAWREQLDRWPMCLRVCETRTEPGSFAQKCNVLAGFPLRGTWAEGIRPEPAPWVMLVGDDVAFHPGWAAAALAAGARRNVCVVGTNTAGPIPDGGTPHPLIRRSYIADRGASWDGPGSLCHEGYRHNFVDVEIAVLAKNRGVWADAPDAVVEHLCVYQGKAPHDDTYQISSDTVDADRALWEFRQGHYANVR